MSDRSLDQRRILIGVAGGVAAYKTAALTSGLVQAGAEVRVLMTDAATRFVGPLTFEALSGRPVHTSQWSQTEDFQSQHIALARWAELLVIAPATANTLARLAGGLCDNTITTIACALPRETPVLLAPAMNAQMWENPITRRNVATLRDLLGYRLVGPGSGWQACRTEGAGRMSEPGDIHEHAAALLAGADSR